jgi:hypothetical protein
MAFHFHFGSPRRRVVVLVLATLVPAVAWAAGRPAPKAPAADAPAEAVDMFKAIDQGDIAVKVVHKDSKEAKVVVENKTDRPLTVKLPEAFGTKPILAQINPGLGGVQAGGGGFNPGMGMMNIEPEKVGLFNIAPETVGQIKVATVCLEHGKPDPRPNIPYEIVPIEKLTDKPGVKELCQMLGAGQINQRAAQAAAWHLNNNMSWEQLAAKRIKHANGTSEPYFTPQEIRAAMQGSTIAMQQAQQQKPTQPDETQGRSRYTPAE